MASYSKFYPGNEYGFTPKFSSKYDPFMGGYHIPASQIGMAIDPRTAAQIKKASEQLSSGTKTVEIQMTQPNIADAIPKQHLQELARLRKLVGTDLTLHGPLVEPTGVIKQGWDETQRLLAERQMWDSLQRGQVLNKEGNLVVTFHSSNGLPEPETKVIVEKDGKKEEQVTGIWVVNDKDGQFTQITPHADYLLDKKANPEKELQEQNKKAWETALTQLSYHTLQGKESFEAAIKPERLIRGGEETPEDKKAKEEYKQLWLMSKSSEGMKKIEKEVFRNEVVKKDVQDRFARMNYGEIYIKDSYTEMQEQFNRAWIAINKDKNNSDFKTREKAEEDLKKLKEFRQNIINNQKTLFLTENVDKLAEEVQRGVNTLNSLSSPPRIFRPLKEFAIDKASETFANLAYRSYSEFKENAPIISIENPPAGSGLHRAEDLKLLVEEARKKFVEKASKHMPEKEAKKQAERLIGVTWDVGHINMIKKYGYDDTSLAKETETVGPFIKHVHLSDNFGAEHTELPMGMGNVPMKAHMEIIQKYNDKVKKIIETGDWYQHFQTTPFTETLEAFGSPIYAMNMAPYWSNNTGLAGGYFSGYGFNPEIHHSMYGAGFSSLPIELGGQVPGSRNRLSGTPTD